ncbi:PspA/IM30 family protein [Prosthecomicrobium hirschii]|uniref:PspA/IM30 family protein n=1 Tax=Prosthecodimorpha hirschii TaxID=665126 RepID=UPI00221F1030|nr:PspA/IM30 family protein [Prosthecomicrobium hirschii]MCW1839403.1 PspA/IM30 family protein [Prosthecomicrobium hirschii]
MLKTIITLMRGEAAAAEEAFADRHALALLDQQIRDGAAALGEARKALAVAIAGDRAEEGVIAAAEARIRDLEARVMAALEVGDDGLAEEGAAAIAGLEADRGAAADSRRLFAAEIGRLKAHVADAEARLARLDRGRRTARAAEAVRTLRRGRIEAPSLHRATLREAETTLERLRSRQRHVADAEAALDGLERETGPDAVAARMAAAGHGPRPSATANDVIARLRRRMAGDPPAGL